MRPAEAKRKGAETESALVAWMQAHGTPYVERRRLNGSSDRGDITGLPGVVCEIKSGARLDIAGWLDELAVEMRNDAADQGAVIVRPKGKPHPDAWFAVLPLPLWWALMKDGGWR
jgi:hypothetical protein